MQTKQESPLLENARGVPPVPYPVRGMYCLGWGEGTYPVLVLVGGVGVPYPGLGVGVPGGLPCPGPGCGVGYPVLVLAGVPPSPTPQ